MNSQYTNVSPRVGFAYSPTDRFVVRGGFGLFYGGLESIGGAPNPGFNYPFSFSSGFTAPGCSTTANICPTDGLTLATGFQNAINQGLQNFLSTPGLVGSQTQVPRLLQRAIQPLDPVRLFLHAQPDHRLCGECLAPPDRLPGSECPLRTGRSAGQFAEHPALPRIRRLSVQRLRRRRQLQFRPGDARKTERKGLYFLATYTYSHALDDTATPLMAAQVSIAVRSFFPSATSTRTPTGMCAIASL